MMDFGTNSRISLYRFMFYCYCGDLTLVSKLLGGEIHVLNLAGC
jgi:hypothetical protein